jgi:hypothetical protein
MKPVLNLKHPLEERENHLKLIQGEITRVTKFLLKLSE